MIGFNGSSNGHFIVQEMTEYQSGIIGSCSVQKSSSVKSILSLTRIFADPPGPPENPSVDDVTSTTCQVTWQPPKFDGGSPVTGYHVERRQTDSSRWVKATKSPVTDLTFKVTDLIEGMEYEFRVFAENKVGPGPPSVPTSPPVIAKEPYGECL